MTTASQMPSVARVPLAGLLAWLVPGLGHLFVGERVRGLIYLITITVTFWGGIAIGGVRDTVDPQARTTWFLAQTCADTISVSCNQYIFCSFAHNKIILSFYVSPIV